MSASETRYSSAVGASPSSAEGSDGASFFAFAFGAAFARAAFGARAKNSFRSSSVAAFITLIRFSNEIADMLVGKIRLLYLSLIMLEGPGTPSTFFGWGSRQSSDRKNGTWAFLVDWPKIRPSCFRYRSEPSTMLLSVRRLHIGLTPPTLVSSPCRCAW